MRSYLDAEYCRQVSRQWDFATAALGNWGNEGAVHERSPKALEMQAAVEQTACGIPQATSNMPSLVQNMT